MINLKDQLRHGMKGLNYHLGQVLYQIFKITLNISLKKLEKVTYNPSILMYVNKIENRIKFKIKTGFHLVLLTPETMKLPRSTKSEIKKNKNGENVTNLEITD